MPMITFATPLVVSAVAVAFMIAWMIEMRRSRAASSDFGFLDD